ncbi:hypothetical protein [Planomonospora algeriensis]
MSADGPGLAPETLVQAVAVPGVVLDDPVVEAQVAGRLLDFERLFVAHPETVRG